MDRQCESSSYIRNKNTKNGLRFSKDGARIQVLNFTHLKIKREVASSNTSRP